MRAALPLLLLTTTLLTSCGLISPPVKKLDHRTLETLGGIAIGKPYTNDRHHVLVPVVCDVSGTRHITTQPTRLESSLACVAPDVLVKGQVIWITVKTRRTAKHLSSQCPDIDLGQLPRDTYLVYYRDPDGSEQPIGIVMTKNLRF